MDRKRLVLIALVAALLCLALSVSLSMAASPGGSGGAQAAAASATPGASAYEYFVGLSDGIGRRVAGTPGGAAATNWIADQFTSAGYTPQVQAFSFVAGGKTRNTANVIAVKPGTSSKVILIGAHYDSSFSTYSGMPNPINRGAADNATGVAVVLDVAAQLQSVTTPDTLVFIAFGGEEWGSKGSGYYVNHLTPTERSNIALAINLDSPAGGDQLCVYNGPKSPVGFAARMQMQRIARQNGTPLVTNPGLTKLIASYNYKPIPYGETEAYFSDTDSFAAKHIPWVYFEATNWLLGDNDGYVNTAKDGIIWHTNKDTVAFWEIRYAGRIERQLGTVVDVIDQYLSTASF
jgi:alkaline phosphatase isozyme conversion protein